jgi:glutathione S-transferase
VAAKFAWAAGRLQSGQYLMGERFTVADGYMLYALRYWQRLTQSMPDGFADYFARVNARPAVAASLAAEGLT